MSDADHPISPDVSQSVLNIGKFFTDVSYLGIANIIVFVFSIVQTIIIPKLLSVEDYGNWRFFVLYITFSGLLHLGFVDGLYLCWAGKSRKTLNFDIRQASRAIILLLLLTTGVLFIIFASVSIAKKDIIYLLLVCCCILNLNTFFQITLQATKDFKTVSRQYALLSVIFNLSILVLFILNAMYYYTVMLGFIGAQLCILAYYIIIFRKELFKIESRHYRYFDIIFKYISIGWPLLLGNFLALAITSADLISISALFSVRQFAFYSFAIAILSVVGLLTRTIATVFFPHLAGTSPKTKIKVYQFVATVIIVVWGIIIGIYPLAEIFVGFFLEKYVSSLSYLRILLIVVVFATTIQVLHINYFQLYFKQKKYFFVTLAVGCIIFPLCILISKLTDNLAYIALLKVIIFFLWFTINELLLRSITRQSYASIAKRLFVVIVLIAFFVIMFQFYNHPIRMLVYYLGAIPTLYFFFRKEIGLVLNRQW